MTEQHKADIETKALAFGQKCDPLNQTLEKQADVRFGFLTGAQEVIEHPERYGLQPVNQWISVNDMPPENSGLYFVYDGKDVGIARMSVLAFRTLTSNEVYQNVTHYQTIIKPQPPINERDEG